MVAVEVTSAGRRRRGGRRAESSRCWADIDEPGVDTRIIIRKYGLRRRRTVTAAVEEARQADGRAPCAVAARRARAGRRGPDGLPGRDDRHHRRRARQGLRRCRSRSSACRTATTGSACTSPTSRTTCAEGSALDEEAFERGTSVYFPERALHMFPEALATGLCSLNPGVDRLVQSCLMEVDGEGRSCGTSSTTASSRRRRA